MARKIIILLPACIVIGIVMSLFLNRAHHSCIDSYESLRDVMGRQLEDARTFWGPSGAVVGASDTLQAIKTFDAHILPTLEYCSEPQIRGMRCRIAEGKAWVYTVAEDVWQTFYFLELTPSSMCHKGKDCPCPLNNKYGFPYYVSRRNTLTGVFVPPCENHGLLELLPREAVPDVERPISAYEDYCERLPRIKDALPKIGEVDPYPNGKPIDVSAIVDVADVQLTGVTGFDYERRHENYRKSCVATYQIRLDVREVEQGILQSDVLILETQLAWDEFKRPFEWVYYRGMTLRIGLHREGGVLFMIEMQPVEPYPPYSNDNVSITGGGVLVGGALADKHEGRLEPLTVAYGTHTKVEFRHGDIITSGERATFVDFGVTSSFNIIEMKDGANKSYWESAWFVPRKDGNRE